VNRNANEKRCWPAAGRAYQPREKLSGRRGECKRRSRACPIFDLSSAGSGIQSKLISLPIGQAVPDATSIEFLDHGVLGPRRFG